jgi:hypothetical protein
MREHVETIHLGHLDVEKDQIGRKGVDRLDCFTAVSTLVENFDLRIFLQQQTEIAPRERFVVDNQRLDLCRHFIHCRLPIADFRFV